MVRVLTIFKAGRLLNIDLFLESMVGDLLMRRRKKRRT
jgi:hypothetical protein